MTLVFPQNLVERGICNIVCIGGDGSLTGASMLKEQWTSLLEELLEQKQITEEQLLNRYGTRMPSRGNRHFQSFIFLLLRGV